MDWDNTMVTGISGIKIDMLPEAKVSIFTDNDLTHINNDHFEINLVARLLNQIYVVPLYFTLTYYFTLTVTLSVHGNSNRIIRHE